MIDLLISEILRVFPGMILPIESFINVKKRHKHKQETDFGGFIFVSPICMKNHLNVIGFVHNLSCLTTHNFNENVNTQKEYI